MQPNIYFVNFHTTVLFLQQLLCLWWSYWPQSVLQAALMGLWEQNRPPGALSTRAPGHRAQGGCFTCRKYIKRVFNKKNVKGFIIALSCVVICVCQDNKEWHEGSLLVHLSWQGLVSLLLFRQLPRTISPVFTYLNWIRYDGYPNQNKNGLGIQEATMFCFWNKVYVDFFFFQCRNYFRDLNLSK